MTLSRFPVPAERAHVTPAQANAIRAALNAASLTQNEVAWHLQMTPSKFSNILCCGIRATPEFWEGINTVLQNATKAAGNAPAPKTEPTPPPPVKPHHATLAACYSQGMSDPAADAAREFWIIVRGQNALAQLRPITDAQTKAGCCEHERVYRMGRSWFVTRGSEPVLVGRRDERFKGE